MQLFNFIQCIWPNWSKALAYSFFDRRLPGRSNYPMQHVVFAVILLFIQRQRSLRAFCFENQRGPFLAWNLEKWFPNFKIPTDDSIRYTLETIPTGNINRFLKDMHQQIERRKILDEQKFFGNLELVNFDGTGQLSSSRIHCEKCLTRQPEQGPLRYHHGQLLVSLTNAKGTYSLPLYFEPIEKRDTQTEYSKNDCELEAGKRLLQTLKQYYPKRNFCILADNLFAVDPILRLLRAKQWNFIITAKPDRNKELFFMFDYVYEQKQYHECRDKNGNLHKYCWSKNLPLKSYRKSESPIFVHLIIYEEINPEGEVLYSSSWITDLPIERQNVALIAKAGRSRFGIENRNFNEQKNLGFQTEHNFGHSGNLPNVFFGLAQVAQVFTELFALWREGNIAIAEIGSKRRYFERLSVLMGEMVLADFDLNNKYLKFVFENSG